MAVKAADAGLASVVNTRETAGGACAGWPAVHTGHKVRARPSPATAKMMLGEPLIKEWLEANPFVAPAVYLLVMGGVLGGGWMRNRIAKQPEQAA